MLCVEAARMSLLSGLASLLREAPIYLAEPVVRIWSAILPKSSQVFTKAETKREVLIVMFKSQIHRFLLGAHLYTFYHLPFLIARLMEC